jgi:hypothetical protein
MAAISRFSPATSNAKANRNNNSNRQDNLAVSARSSSAGAAQREWKSQAVALSAVAADAVLPDVESPTLPQKRR